MDGVQCNSNRELGRGGCLYNSNAAQSYFEILRVTMDDNQAQTDGGAIAVVAQVQNNPAWGNIENSSFMGNSAILSGGAVFAENIDVIGIDDTNVTSVVFSNNDAAFGRDFCLPVQGGNLNRCLPRPEPEPGTAFEDIEVVVVVASLVIAVFLFLLSGTLVYNRRLRKQIEEERKSLTITRQHSLEIGQDEPTTTTPKGGGSAATVGATFTAFISRLFTPHVMSNQIRPLCPSITSVISHSIHLLHLFYPGRGYDDRWW